MEYNQSHLTPLQGHAITLAIIHNKLHFGRIKYPDFAQACCMFFEL